MNNAFVSVPSLQKVLCLISLATLGSPGARMAFPAEMGQRAATSAGPEEKELDQNMLTIRADSQEKTKDVHHLRGHVRVTRASMELTADEASYDEVSQQVTARGHVTFTEPNAHLEADEAHYDFRTQQGQFSRVHGYVHTPPPAHQRMLITPSPFYVQAREVDRLDSNTFTAQGARISSCQCEDKGWSVSAARARLKVDDKVVSHHAAFRLLRVPLFYFPALVHSIAHEPRQTGFLLPHVGNSSQKGVIVGDGFYWAISPSADLTLGLENFSLRGPAATVAFRAQPRSASSISIQYFGAKDQGTGPLRQIKAPGQTLRALAEANDLGHGFRGVLDVDYITSLAFRFTYSNSFTEAVASEAHQTGFLTKDFDAYSLNFSLSRYQDFLSTQRKPGNSINIRQTPSFSFSSMDKQAGKSMFYFAFDASTAGVARTEPAFETPNISERVDVHPQVTLRGKPIWGLHITPSVGARATHYGTSLKPGGAPLNRFLGDFAVDVRPPSFDKIFARPVRGYWLKHVIEPEIRYHLVRAAEAQNLTDVVRFDQTDILAETNEFEYSLTNSLLVRKDVPDGAADKPQARSLLSWRLSQKYYFDPTFGGALQPGNRVVFDPTISLTGFAFARGRRLSPLVSVVKFSPASDFDAELRADLNPTGTGLLNAGVTSRLHHGPVGLTMTDFFINRTAALSTPRAPTTNLSSLPSFHLLRTVITYGDPNRKGFSAAFGVDYNFVQQIAHQAVSQASYNFGCWALDFEFRRFALGPLRRDNQFRISLSLANVGTFGNLKPRERLY